MHFKKIELETSDLSADNFQNILDLHRSIPEPAIWSDDTGQRIRVFDSCQLISTRMCNIRLHLGSQTTTYS